MLFYKPSPRCACFSLRFYSHTCCCQSCILGYSRSYYSRRHLKTVSLFQLMTEVKPVGRSPQYALFLLPYTMYRHALFFEKKKKMYRQNIYLVKRPVPIPREVFSVSLKRQQYERSLSRHTESLTAVTHQRKKESRHTTMHSTRTQNSLCTIENLSDKSFWNTYKTFSFFFFIHKQT